MKVHKYWNFNIDQGGTFTDIIGITPDKKLIIKKVLTSKNNVSYNPVIDCLLYTSPSPRDRISSRMPSSA